MSQRKVWDFQAAKQIILENQKEAISASLGIEESWYPHNELVWTKEKGFFVDLNTLKEIMGVDGSYWGTPSLELVFPDKRKSNQEVYKYEEASVEEL